MYAAPSFQTTPVSEDSIIPAIVIDVVPAERRYSSGSDSSHDTIGQESKTGLVSRFVKKKKGKVKNPEAEREKKLTKVIYMPRREYVIFLRSNTLLLSVLVHPYFIL